jgi:hypothetical protein
MDPRHKWTNFQLDFRGASHKKLNGQKVHSFLNQTQHDATRRNNVTQQPSPDHGIVTMPLPFKKNQSPIQQSSTLDPSSSSQHAAFHWLRPERLHL